jgi:hydrophobic/amphiphilic exporter-1 (mainly G- bacteria), HAE1 family
VRHTELALMRPVTTLMVFLATAAVGLIAGRLLPLEEFPALTFPGMEVRIPYPGSTPEEVERLIARPVEEALATLPGIKQVTSTSTADMASFHIDLTWGRKLEAASFDIRAKLDSIRPQLPPGADRVIVQTFSSADQPVVVVRLSANQDLSREYDMLEKYLKRPLERVPGVARVDLQGVQRREVRVLVDSDRAAAHGVDLPTLGAALQKSNFAVSAGELTERGRRFIVRPLGEFHSVEEVRRLLIRPDLHLGDVADVALVTPQTEIGRHVDLRPAIGLDVFKATQANVVDVVDRVLVAIDAARDLPSLQGVKMVIIGNQGQSIRNSLTDLRNAGLLGGAFALMVLFFFLRDWPTTLIVSLAVPCSLIVTLAAMYFLGLTLNVLTMMGMMLAVGMLVDNAVVVTESIFRHRQLDPAHPQSATVAGVSEVGVATMAGTAATIIVFLPIVFGAKSQISIFLTHVAIPIVVAMLASLLIAQTLIPLLTSRLAAPKPVAPGSWLGRMQERYARMLGWVLRSPWKTAGLVVLTLLSPVPLFALGVVKVDPFPQGVGRNLYLEYKLDGTYPLERVEEAVNRVEAFLESHRKEFDIKNLYSRYEPGEAETAIYLTPKGEAHIDSREVMERVTKGMPEIIIGKPTFRFDDPSGAAGFNVRLTGESTAVLADLSVAVAQRLGQVPGVEGMHSEAKNGDSEVQIVVDRTRVIELGLSTADVARTVAAALRGDKLRELRSGDHELNMRLAFRPNDKQRVDDLMRLLIPLPAGGYLPLGAVARFHEQPGERAIERTNRLTSVIVAGILAKGTTLDEARARAKPALEAFPWPPGYSWKFGRGLDEQDDTIATMLQNILLAVVLIVLVMAALFESLLHPLAIVSSILFAVVGVFWFFAVTQTVVTLMAMIGIMILIGVVVNIGIVLIAHVVNLRAAGLERNAAIVQAGRDRLRPILMTTATTLLALMPLAIGDAQAGGGGPAYYPMARAIIGGLAFGALVSLFFVPAFYVWLDDLGEWRRRLAARARSGQLAVAQRSSSLPTSQ